MLEIIVNNKEPIKLNIEPIWLDDTASMIKQKLTEVLNVSTEEMYLYVESITKLSPELVYSSLVRNKNVGVTVNALKGFCRNIYDIEQLREIMEELEPMDALDAVPYALFERFFNEEREYFVKTPVGVSFIIDPRNTSLNNIVMPTNPYDALKIKSNRFTVVSTNEETLISKLPNIYSNPVLHVCTATEVIKAYEYPTVGELVTLYFPKLFAKLPNSLGPRSPNEEYLEKIGSLKKELLKQSENLFKVNTKYYKNIEYWNSSSFGEIPEVPNGSVGITALTASYMSTPSQTHQLPIDFIFKSIHATKKMPFVRYIISKRREQMFRLYAPEEAMDDKRIPFLPRAMVNKIIVKSKKVPGIGVFSTHFGADIYLFLELKENGEIQVQLETPDTRPILMSQVDEIGVVINEFVKTVNEILKQTDIILTPMTNVIQHMTITAVDWIMPFKMLNQKEVFNATKSKLGCSVFLPESVMVKEQGKKEKEKSPAKTKAKAIKQKTEMSFVYTRVSNFSVDMPEELQTKLFVFYSVDTHQLYMKISNLPHIKYLQLLPNYVFSFVGLLTNKTLEDEYKSSVGMSTYGYNKQKGEQELQDLMFEMQEKEMAKEESAELEEEQDDLEKIIEKEMKKVPQSPESVEKKKEKAEEKEEDFDLGEFELGEFEDEFEDFDE